ncbi:MAG: DUF1360 domain-containing protein [Streptosporangiales bacterium]
MTDQASELLQRARAERTAYDHEHEQPIVGYGAVLASFGCAMGLAAGIAKLAGKKLPVAVRVTDLIVGGVAVHKAGRLIALDAVTSPLRAPFNRFKGPTGGAEVAEEVRAEGPWHAVGEMVSCPFRLGPWLSAAYTTGLVVAPRLARTVAGGFAVVGISDWLQQGYEKLKS